MKRVVIAGRTRMRDDCLCIGGHDLDDRFRSVRLLDKFGDHWPSDSAFRVGDVWAIRYQRKGSARPPHVEDAFVMEHRHVARVDDLKSLVLRHRQPWAGGPEVLFDGTVRNSGRGSAYIPKHGRLPGCSTGYWLPDEDLAPRILESGRVRVESTGKSAISRITWVGVEDPPGRIEARQLVRVSLSRLFGTDTVPEGYYVQISGVL